MPREAVYLCPVCRTRMRSKTISGPWSCEAHGHTYSHPTPLPEDPGHLLAYDAQGIGRRFRPVAEPVTTPTRIHKRFSKAPGRRQARSPRQPIGGVPQDIRFDLLVPRQQHQKKMPPGGGLLPEKLAEGCRTPQALYVGMAAKPEARR